MPLTLKLLPRAVRLTRAVRVMLSVKCIVTISFMLQFRGMKYRAGAINAT